MLNALINFVMRQRMLILLLTVAIIGAGIFAWETMQIDAFPDVTNVQVMVLSEAPGLAAVDVEQQITYPIEANMSGLPNVRLVRSLSKASLSQVVVIFEDSVNIYFARQIVLERLQAAKERLPEGIEPELGPISTGLGEIYQYTLESEKHDLTELRSIQNWLVAPQLQAVPGVTEINSMGGHVRQYHVIVKPEQLLKFGITMSEVLEAIEKNNANVGGSFILHGWEQSYVRSVGLFSGVSDIDRIVLKSKDGTPVSLRDLAEVTGGSETRQGVVTRDGTGETVCGAVVMLKGANAKEVVDKVKEKIREITPQLGRDGVNINTFYDRTSLIQACVGTMRDALLFGGLLVLIILFIFLLELRAGLIVILALPLSTLIAFAMMNALGMTANLMTLGGLAIAIGIVVDGTIVVTENAVRLLGEKSNERKSSLQVVTEATQEIAVPVLFSILTTVVVFLPLLTLEDIEGKMFKPLGITICLALFGALVVALVIAPVLCSFMLSRKVRDRDNVTLRAVKSVYRPLLLASIRHRYVVIAVALILMGVSVALFARIGSEFMPSLDEGSIAINVIRLPSASIEGSREVSLEMERRIRKIPEVETVVTKSGRAEISEDPMGPEQSDVFVMLKPQNEWRKGITKTQILQTIRKELHGIPGIRPGFSQPIALRVNELISGIKSDLAIKLFGDDLTLLREKGAEISGLLARIEGAKDIKLEQTAGFSQLNVEIDRGEIARHSINVSDVNDIIETAGAGKVATWLVEGRKRVAVVLRFPPGNRDCINEMERILVPSPMGYHVQLGSIAKIKWATETEGPAQVSHENNHRRIVVECNIEGRDTESFVREARERIKAVQDTLPPGYFLQLGGQFENQQRAQKRLNVVVPVALLLIFVFVASALAWTRSAWLVLLNLPFSLIGGVFALYLSGLYLSVPASVGFVILFGTAMETALILVSYIRKSREQGVPLEQAVVHSALQRVRPILMATLTTILGLLPLLFASGPGAEVQRPLAIVLVGGLFSSTALTLLVIPAVYGLFDRGK